MVEGVPWGGPGPFGMPIDVLCRGIRVVSLHTDARLLALSLPAAQKAQGWAVDQPILVGNWLVYTHLIGMTPPVPWEIIALDLVTHREHVLSRWNGIGLDIPPLVSSDGDMVLWTTVAPDGTNQVQSRIETYDLRTGQHHVVATSSAYGRTQWDAHGVRYYDAYLASPIVAFLHQTAHGADVWVEDLRTGHLHPITHTGTEHQPVVTGSWVAWSDSAPRLRSEYWTFVLAVSRRSLRGMRSISVQAMGFWHGVTMGPANSRCSIS